MNIFAGHFHREELIPFIRSAFETKLIFSTLLVMIFKEILADAGVITALPEAFSALSIPAFLIFTLIFLFGTIVAGTQAIIVLCMPMAMEAVGAGHTGLALFTLIAILYYGILSAVGF